jgi:hypothetical protein
MLIQILERFLLIGIIIIFYSNSYSQSFYSANGNYLGKIEFYSQVQRNCGNCGVLLDKLGNKIGEVSPPGGYRRYTNNNGDVICSWSMNRNYCLFDKCTYSVVQDQKQRSRYTIYDGNRKISSASCITNETTGKTKVYFYSTDGSLLLTASCPDNTEFYIDLSIAFFLIFR